MRESCIGKSLFCLPEKLVLNQDAKISLFGGFLLLSTQKTGITGFKKRNVKQIHR